MHFAECLETFFDSHDDLHIFDILQLHGNLARDEKAQIINLFINGCEEISDLNLNILCATSGVGNAGINSKEIRSVRDTLGPCGNFQNCAQRKPIFSPIVKDTTIIIMLNLFVGGDRTITDERNLGVIVKAFTAYPRANQLILSVRAKKIIEPQTVKKILLVFITHGILKIEINKETNNVVFSPAMSKHDPTKLAMQDYSYWHHINIKNI